MQVVMEYSRAGLVQMECIFRREAEYWRKNASSSNSGIHTFKTYVHNDTCSALQKYSHLFMLQLQIPVYFCINIKKSRIAMRKENYTWFSLTFLQVMAFVSLAQVDSILFGALHCCFQLVEMIVFTIDKSDHNQSYQRTAWTSFYELFAAPVGICGMSPPSPQWTCRAI